MNMNFIQKLKNIFFFYFYYLKHRPDYLNDATMDFNIYVLFPRTIYSMYFIYPTLVGRR